MGRKPVVAQPKPVRLSEWIKQSGRNVTRGECVNVIAHLMERRLMVERELQRQRKWRVRFWRWLTNLFTGSREPTEEEIDRATAAALNPEAASTEDEPDPEQEEEEPQDGAIEGAGEPEQLLEGADGTAIRFRDKRKREES